MVNSSRSRSRSSLWPSGKTIWRQGMCFFITIYSITILRILSAFSSERAYYPSPWFGWTSFQESEEPEKDLRWSSEAGFFYRPWALEPLRGNGQWQNGPPSRRSPSHRKNLPFRAQPVGLPACRATSDDSNSRVVLQTEVIQIKGLGTFPALHHHLFYIHKNLRDDLFPSMEAYSINKIGLSNQFRWFLCHGKKCFQ